MIQRDDGTILMVPFGGTLDIILAHMQRRGSSVVLNFGEDTELWECSWITDGKRYTTFSADPTKAARECLRKVYGY